MDTYASREDLDRLDRDVVACRVAKGKVPDGCTGLSLQGRITQRYAAGKKVSQVPDHGKLWWVRLAPFHLRFAPEPKAPEAGVELALQVVTGRDTQQGLVRDELAWFLDSHAAACLTLADIQRALTGDALLRPPPAMQAEEADSLRRDLTAALLPRMGLECLSLRRVDLYPEINCALADAPLAAAVTASASAPPGAGHATTLAITLTDTLALDARYQTRLFRELPRLAQRLRELPWPEAHPAFQAQQAVLQRLEHLAATTNRLPTLESRINPRSIPETTVHLLAAECRRASEGLDAAWVVLDTTSRKPEIARLADIVAGIEAAIARRRTPWWQIPCFNPQPTSSVGCKPADR